MFKDFFRYLRQISIVSDELTTVSSFIAAYFIRLLMLKVIPFGAPTELVDYWELALVIMFLWWWIFSLQGAYTSEAVYLPTSGGQDGVPNDLSWNSYFVEWSVPSEAVLPP